nr:hypothetical protein [Paraflavitalea speifideiaquila]
MATVTLNLVEEEVIPVRSLYEGITNQAKEQPVSITLSIGNSILKGTIRGVFDQKLVHVSWSRNETKYLTEAYIRYLAGVAADEITGAVFISGAKKEAAYMAVPINKAEALQRLTKLVSIYKAGFTGFSAFYPDFDIKPKQVADLDLEQFRKLVEKKMELSDDPYIVPEYRKGFYNREEALEQYKVIARHILMPLAEVFPGYFD